MPAVAEIYNELFAFEQSKYKGNAYPIHKRLQYEQKEGEQRIEDITDIIQTRLSPDQSLHILDAGCGVGYSLLKLCKNPVYSGLGISLSKDELQFARKNSQEQGLEERCNFKHLSFDENFDENFDLILCLESIKHAPDWKHSLKNLIKHMPGGARLFLLEDFYTSFEGIGLANAFKNAWSVPHLFTQKELCAWLESQGLIMEHQAILTDKIAKKSPMILRIKEYICRALNRILPKGKYKTLLKVYQGALIMDYFYAKGYFSYQLLEFRKLDVSIESEKK